MKKHINNICTHPNSFRPMYNFKKAYLPFHTFLLAPINITHISDLSLFKFVFNFFKIYLFLAVLGLHGCTQTFSSCGEQGLLFVAVHGLLIAVASLVAEHGL